MRGREIEAAEAVLATWYGDVADAAYLCYVASRLERPTTLKRDALAASASPVYSLDSVATVAYRARRHDTVETGSGEVGRGKEQQGR